MSNLDMAFEYSDAASDPSVPNPSHRSNMEGSAPLTFRGTTDIMKLPDFMTIMQVQFLTRRIVDEGEKIAFFGRNHAGGTFDYDQFSTEFHAHFLIQLDPNKVLNTMNALKQTGTGIEAYNTKFKQLWSLMPAGYWTEKGALLSYMRGLIPETSHLVALTSPSTLDEAFQAAYSTVAIDNRFFEHIVPSQRDADGDIVMTGAAVTHAPRYPKHGERGRGGNDRYASSNNYSAGRLSRTECMKRHLCFKCQKPGHNFRECRVGNSNASNRF